MTLTQAAEAVLIALETLADERGNERYCRQPVTVIASIAGVSVAYVYLAFRRLHRTSRIYTAGVPTDPCEKCLIVPPRRPVAGAMEGQTGTTHLTPTPRWLSS